jgi:hypothetical protein
MSMRNGLIGITLALAAGPACHARATQLDGATYVFAQALGEAAGVPPEAAKESKAQIRLAGVKAGTQIEVVGENRKLSAEEGGFADEFAPLQEHVYRIAEEAK